LALEVEHLTWTETRNWQLNNCLKCRIPWEATASCMHCRYE